MRLKADWIPHLHAIRRREVEKIFGQVPDGAFASGLELGAGDGFQSRLLARWVRRLTSTDFTIQASAVEAPPSVSFLACDAEEVDRVLAGRRFDLVFTSNLLEHLPDPDRALRAMHAVLADDGIAIHVMPGRFWKVFHLALHLPNRAVLLLERVGRRGAARPVVATNPVARDNNPKSNRPVRSRWFRMLVPVPHGAAGSHMRELIDYGRSRWRRRLESAGFEIVTIANGPVASGYGFGLDRIRAVLERAGLASEHIYVTTKVGCRSRYERYFRRERRARRREEGC